MYPLFYFQPKAFVYFHFISFYFITPFYFQPVTGTGILTSLRTEKLPAEVFCLSCSNKAEYKTVRHVSDIHGYSVAQQLSHNCHIETKINLNYILQLTELLRLYKITLSMSNISVPF